MGLRCLMSIADAGGVIPGYDRDHIAQHIQDDDRVQGGNRADKKSEQCPWPQYWE